jgi:hypothetical protein
MIHSLPVFLAVTVIFMGGCAVMTGTTLARTWRPWWHGAAYALGLGAADRFIGFALFGAPLLSPSGYALDTALLAAATLAAWRVARVRRLCGQYPWLYERTGPFGWRDKITHRH